MLVLDLKNIPSDGSRLLDANSASAVSCRTVADDTWPKINPIIYVRQKLGFKIELCHMTTRNNYYADENPST